VHITSMSDPATFREVCTTLGVKPVHAHNIVGSAVVSTELLSQSTGFGTREDALLAMSSTADRFRQAGLAVVREKVELDPRHPGAPAQDHEAEMQYFEAHLRIDHAPGERARVLGLRDELYDLGHTLWASYNPLKRVEPGAEVSMLTARSHTMGLVSFREHAEAAQEYCARYFSMRPLILEWAIADNNTALDSVWMVR
jgi:hypothetical protein